jgi:hypothetical protein
VPTVSPPEHLDRNSARHAFGAAFATFPNLTARFPLPEDERLEGLSIGLLLKPSIQLRKISVLLNSFRVLQGVS